jgi:xylulokinase
LLALSVHRRALGGGASLAEVCDRYVELDETKAAHPNPRNVALYRDVFGEFIETLRREYGVEA